MNPAYTDDVFLRLDLPEQMDQLVERSFAQPVIIFKHSPACGTSAYAFDELDTYRQDPSAHEVYLVDVLRNRPLSQALAVRFRVHHESPQLLLVVDGKVAWHTSHYGVSAAALERAVTRLTTAV
jgi:bacillithiol system protein YtxJ